MKALGNIIWMGIEVRYTHELEHFLEELEARCVDPSATVWLKDVCRGWYPKGVLDLAWMSDEQKRGVERYSWSRPRFEASRREPKRKRERENKELKCA
jgi:hypothetical protein